MEIVLSVLSVVLIICIGLSRVRHDFWLYKIMEYPRLQILVLILLLIACWFVYWPLNMLFYQITFGLLVFCMCYLFYKILPYTSLSKTEMHRVPRSDAGNGLKIFSANVYQENKEYGRLLEQVMTESPDIIFLLETNKAWADNVASLKKNYPYTLSAPLENTYGLLFFSRYKIGNERVNFLVKDDLPSIEAVIELPSRKLIQLWGLHPEPPVPGENLYATAKNKELMIIAFKARECKIPVVVFGDLNDVAWSHTTELFRKTSGLLDPRRGRGFYNTFSAHHWYIRFPLDYVFCSKDFGLVSMKRLPKNGSDHFATVTHISLHPDLNEEQEAPKADKAELREAKEMAEKPAEE